GHHPDGFEEDRPAHFALSRASIDEDDRMLDDLGADLGRAVAQLHLERIAFRADLIERERFEQRAPHGFEAASEISNLETEDEARVDAPAFAQQMPSGAPTFDSASGDIAGADDEIVSLEESLDECRKIGRIMAAIGVHLNERGEIALEAISEAVEIRAPKSELGRATKNIDQRIIGPQCFGELARSVGRGIVHDQKLRLGERFSYASDQLLEVLTFVVSRRDDEHAFSISIQPSPLR